MIITYLFRFDYSKISEVTSQIERYFESIGYFEEFSKLKQNYLMLGHCLIIDDKRSKIDLNYLETTLLKMKKDELKDFLKFILDDHIYLREIPD